MNCLGKIIGSILLVFIALNGNAITFSQSPIETDTLSTEELETKIIALTNKVKDENRLVDILSSDMAFSLPVGVAKNIGGIDIIIVIDDISFGVNGAVARAYMTIQFPGSTQNLSFKAVDVAFFPWGFLNGRLELVTEAPINIGNMTLNLLADKTFVDFDCMGYKKASLGAVMEFPKNMLVKEDIVTRDIMDNEMVKSRFVTEFTDFNDILVDISMDPFQLTSLDGFGFYVDAATLDLSDVRNPTFGAYTSTYISGMGLGEDATLWRGVYVKNFEVKLPKNFVKESELAPAIGAEDMIFDENGITGKIYATNLLTLDKGDIAGWKFSFDKIDAAFTSGNFDKFSFDGQLVLPVSENDAPMSYSAFIDSDKNYVFAISPPDVTDFDLWAAKIQLAKNSVITIDKKEGKFFAKASLHGMMTIEAPGDNKVSLADVQFENMVIQSDAPKFSISSFEAKVGNMGNFPMQVTKMQYEKQGELHGIELGVSLSLVKASDNGFSADGGFTVYGKQNADIGISSWSYSHTDFNSFGIDINQSAFAFKGELSVFKKDPIYGNGIKGMIAAQFNPGPSVTSMVQFGNVNNYRYWYVDAFVTFDRGVPIFPSVNLVGFGGGASYHMVKNYQATKDISVEPVVSFDTTGTAGRSLSGITYVPDNSIGLGVKAGVTIAGTPSPKSWNATATFGMEFMSGGGLSEVTFKGEALIMSSPGTPKEQAKIYAGMDLTYDAVNKIFMGNMEAYVNVGDALTGLGEGGRAGTIQMYFAPDDWYVYMGHPTDRMGLNVAGLAQLDAYLCTGTIIPTIPPLPSNVVSILGDIDLDMCRNLSSLDAGKGFVFGASLNVETGRKDVAMFYGQFDAGIGFDLMMLDYGNNAHCSGSNDPLGINGWYASGQMYGYFQGVIGMHISMFGKSQDVDILDIGAAAVLQAQAPNPIYMKGAVGGYYNVLGGLVKGQCNFELEIGEQCDVVGTSVLDGVNVIAAMSPRQGDTGVDVFATPQVAFNFQIDKEFELTDLENNHHSYRIKLEYFTVTNKGQNIEGEYMWNANKTVLGFESTEILPGKTMLKADVLVAFEEKVGGVWKAVEEGGIALVESRVVTFKTGEAPNYIPIKNIEYCYPVVNMLNLYKDEYAKGYIQLKKGQSYLFDFPADERWVLDARFVCNSGWEQSDFIYNSAEKTISFDIPTVLNLETVYEFKLVNIPVVESAALDENVDDVEALLANGDTLTTKTIEGGVRQSIDEETMLEYDVRTSKYSTFDEKINNLVPFIDGSYQYITGISYMFKKYSGTELFGAVEIEGDGMSPSLLRFNFDVIDNDWYNKYIKELVYEDYPNYGVTLSREIVPKGIPPVNSIDILQSNSDCRLDEQVKTTGIVNWESSVRTFWMHTSYDMYQDYLDLKSQAGAMNYGSNYRLYNLVFNGFQSEIINKYYEFNIQYVLPGVNTVTTTKQLKILHE